MPPKHVPIRTCVSCRTPGDKRGLLRVVRHPDGQVAFDPTGKANGRGAYVCASATCIQTARKQRRLERSLKAETGPELYDTLLSHASTPDAAPSSPPIL